MYSWRKAHGLTQAECNVLIGTESMWGNLEAARSNNYWNKKNRYGIEHHIGLKHLIDIVELIHENQSVWIILDYFDET